MQLMARRRLNSAAFAGIVILSWVARSGAQTPAQVHGVTQPEVSALQREKAQRTDAQKKISSNLLDALRQSQTGQLSASAPRLKPSPLTKTPEGVMVDISATVSDDLLSTIKDLGGRIVNKHPEYKAIRASMPLQQLETLAGRDDVKQILAAVKGRAQAAAIEGDIAHAADLVRAKFGVTGAHVKIGVLSDSIDNGDDALMAAFASGDIDRNKLVILSDDDGVEQVGDGIGEGLAMAEIIHALAPDAEIYFATASGGVAQMAANIKGLARLGCQIIVDDYFYFNESPFQDGPISSAVNDVSAQGVLYFSSARNAGNKKHGTSGTWEGDFHDGGPANATFRTSRPNGRVHVFEPTRGVTLNTIDKLTLTQEDQSVCGDRLGGRVDVFWSDALGAARNDYDLYVVDANGHVRQQSTSSHDGQQDPWQSVECFRQGDSIVIVKEGDAEERFLHLDTVNAIIRYSTDGSVRGHNASGADNAFSVAAVRVPSPPVPFLANPNGSVETFSADGPRRVFFTADGVPITSSLTSAGGKVLSKPDLTAADGVTTTVPQLTRFSGTSAAAPHAAAIAALLLSCTPTPTSAQVRTALQQTALTLEGAMPNANAGYGVVSASKALESACPNLPRTP